jgi:hypothetical protein
MVRGAKSGATDSTLYFGGDTPVEGDSGGISLKISNELLRNAEKASPFT